MIVTVTSHPVIVQVGRAIVGVAGGDLSGVYPNPTVNPGASGPVLSADASARRIVAAHEQAAAPHGGRFPDRGEVMLLADSAAARRVAALGESMNPFPQYPFTDQATLAAQFFGG